MIALLLLGACTGPSLPEGAHALTIASPLDHWAQNGFRRLTPPAPLPSYYPDSAAVEIWVSLPEDGRLQVQTRSDGVPVLAWPPGSVAERVEYRGLGDERRVVDVRGTRLDAEGNAWDHLYRPTAKRPDAALKGYEWPADDERIHAGVVEVLAHEVGDSVRKKMGCRGCHQPNRPHNTRPREHGIVNRGTDATAWFTPSTLLTDTVPTEAYGRHDAGVDHPWLTVRCGSGKPRRTTNKHGAPRHRCADATVPTATLRTAEALAAGDDRAVALCRDREWLAMHTQGGWSALGEAAASCGREANSNDESK